MDRSKVHKTYSDQWWTPLEWMAWARRTLGVAGDIEMFDPCPENWEPEDGSGLDSEWESPAYINHPGGRGSAQVWWEKCMKECGSRPPEKGGMRLVWCAFSIEQLRHMRPSPLEMDGWLVLPRKRISFIWGGETRGTRIQYEQCRSPSNWTVFWTNVRPCNPPEESIIIKTDYA